MYNPTKKFRVEYQSMNQWNCPKRICAISNLTAEGKKKHTLLKTLMKQPASFKFRRHS